MGILRVDKLSGLEAPTAVTGSVYFDGDARNDNLNLAGDPPDLDFQNTDFTFESWVYPTDMSSDRYWCSKGDGNLPGTAMDVRFDSDGQIRIHFYVSSTAYTLHTGAGVLVENVWSHVAVVRSGTSFKSYVNGIETSSATHDITISDVSATFKIGILEGVGTGFKGYMSDFRFVRGKAVYTEKFKPPVYALEPIDGTVLLCCNNPDSVGAEATGKTITVNGDVSISSTVSPGLTKDFTFGTEFNGVTTFDTQGYFVPPSGTTEQRGAGRAIFAGGYVGPARNAFIESVNINSLGNTTKFGTLKDNHVPTSTSSATRQIVAGGYDGSSPVDNIDFITIATSGDSVDFGTLGTARRDFAGLSNNTRSVFGGGTTTGSTTLTVNMEYVTSASLGSGSPFGSLTASGRANASCASPTRGVFFGGYQAFASPVSTYTNVINYITIATTGGGTDFGDLAVDNNGQKGGHAAFSNSTRGVVGGGAIYGPDAPAYTLYDTIEYITMASTGNAQEFGDLTGNNNYGSGISNSTRGIFNQGTSPVYLNTIQYVTIASTGNAQDFGDAINASFSYNNSGSDSHGGLS